MWSEGRSSSVAPVLGVSVCGGAMGDDGGVQFHDLGLDDRLLKVRRFSFASLVGLNIEISCRQ